MKPQEMYLVSAPTLAGEEFIKKLQLHGIPFAAITNNRFEKDRLDKLGVNKITVVNTADHETWEVPEFPVSKVFLFEHSLALCCRYIQICRSWTSDTIYVVTQNDRPRKIYKALGADHVIMTRNGDVTFLLKN